MSEARTTKIEAVDQTLARLLNELRIVTMLRTQGAASRAEIARHLGVTAATVTRLSNGLIAQGLVQEERAPRDRPGQLREIGRPAGRVSLRADGAFFLGVEIGVGVIRFALVNLSAQVTWTREVPCERGLTVDAAVPMIRDQLAALMADARHVDRIRSVGVTVPGIVTSEGSVINLPILGWRLVDLQEELSRCLPIPCSVENNANAAAFGAVYTQPAVASASIVFLKLGMGCGGAAIVQGRLLKGANGLAAELGHMRLSEGGARCSCGQFGCLESWVNLGAIARYYCDGGLAADEELSTLPERIVLAALDGDAKAAAACETFAYWLARGLASLTNVFNPTAILLGGIMRPLIAHVIDKVSADVRAGIIPGMTVPVVLLSDLDRFECAVGVATIAHHLAFDISSTEIPGRVV